MCFHHWAALPNHIREGVCVAYTPGQELPSRKVKTNPEWVKASRSAIIYIADKEGVDWMDDYGQFVEPAAPPEESQDLD